MLIGVMMAAGYSAGIGAAETPDLTAVGPAAELKRADATPVAVLEPSAETLRYYRSGNVLWVIATRWGLLVSAFRYCCVVSIDSGPSQSAMMCRSTPF